jgi:C1A family cysteine protease
MKKILIPLFILAFIVPFTYADDREVAALQELLTAKNASWTAAPNFTTRMTLEEKKNMLGLIPGVYEPANVPIPVVNLAPVRLDRYEAPHTRIKDQGGCGSCYSFGACATYESWKMKVGHTYDLSEQWFMMRAKAIGPYGGCNGWWLDTSMNLLKDDGVANESDCPYLAYESACTSGYPIHRIGGWASTTDKGTILNALQQYGLVYVGFAVYQDFFNYGGGYYEYTSGSLAGYHAVAIVGYDSTGFKVKNSWGTGWGEGGYFRIKYSQMTNSVQFGTCFGGSFYITN